MSDKTENQQKYEQLAKDILILSRNTLLVNLRFLDMALSQFTLYPIEQSTLLTDGKHILFNPKHVLESYKRAKEIPIRDYLHMVMHCVFMHMYTGPNLDQTYWNLACDIAVENVITELDLKAVTTDREWKQTQYISAIKKELKCVTAEKVYSWLKQTMSDTNEIVKISKLFCADDHEVWYKTTEEIETAFGVQLDSEQEKNRQTEGNKQEGESGTRVSMAKGWQKISERMQVDLETFSKKQGKDSSALTQNLVAVTREKYDYTTFLKKFAVMNEVTKINDDEFDYIFYTYGLKLYEKIPLIEPLEYKEEKTIKEFIVAIDTSGSTSGELVQKFVQKTYNILTSTESFSAKINLHIIQCDSKIQEDKKITSQNDFDEYLKFMKIRGLGGTDFRPVFKYVEQLRKEKEFTNLKGLIYFTDGYGEFPSQKPDYDTAFIFIDDEYNNPDVPSWAIKLVLQKDEI